MSKSARIRRASVSQAQAPAAPEVTATVAASAPAAAPVDPVAAAPAAKAAPAPNAVPAAIEALLSNVTHKQQSIEEAIKQIDAGSLRGYDDGLNASKLFGVSWDALASLRPKAFNSTELDPSELTFREALDRADPNTSPLFTDELSQCIKWAVVASSKETFEAAKQQDKNVPSQKDRVDDAAAANAKASLEAKRDEYAASNNGLMRDKAQDALDAIDDVGKLVKLTKALQSTRSKGTNRRAVLSMLDLIEPVITAKTPEDDRGGNYVKWACKAKTLYEEFIAKQIKESGVISAATVEAAVSGGISDFFDVSYGDRLKTKDELQEVSNATLIDRLWDMIRKLASDKKQVITKETAAKLTGILRDAGHLRSDAVDPASLNEGKAQDGTGSNVTSKRTRGAAAGTVSNPEQPVMQPTQQAVAPVQVADAAKPVAARGRVRGTPTQQATPPVGPTADAAAAVLNA